MPLPACAVCDCLSDRVCGRFGVARFRIQATNDMGPSGWSEPSETVKTHPAGKPNPPRRVVAVLPGCGGSVTGLWWQCYRAVVAVLPGCGGSVIGLWWQCYRAVVAVLPRCGGSVTELWWQCYFVVVAVLPGCGGSVTGLWTGWAAKM